ncbi:hypothetical protein WMF31_24905 [Sorangium sp. So ce1036]|uniref:hypothetical protein n=1 Tax=Sorangium sp. So ce1036 TaxID=3133328 RepID=UPI003F0A51EB
MNNELATRALASPDAPGEVSSAQNDRAGDVAVLDKDVLMAANITSATGQPPALR